MYLLVNILDLDQLGKIGPLGSPLNLMIQEHLGDRMLPGGVYKKSKIDDCFLIVECTEDRATAIEDALHVIGKHKMKRKVRTLQRKNVPNGKDWHHFSRD
jgi:hypothetical protein